jgi:hypothetical protein
MQHGDISNGTPPVVLVHIDVVTIWGAKTEKYLFGLRKRTSQHRYYDKLVLNALWRYAVNNNVTLEVFSPGDTIKQLTTIEDDLDRTGANPFRRTRLADSVQDVVSSLPYEPNTLGVIDLPERGMMYGSRWIDRLSL